MTLELGGKSPQIVFPGADLRAAANGLVAGVFAATGQTCMAGSRLIVHESVHDELVRLVAERAAQIRLGDPNDPETEMGPVADGPQYESIWVELTGGTRGPSTLGWRLGTSTQGLPVDHRSHIRRTPSTPG